tara:strand:- start:2658 stop:3410 length:753 start_codon:yes stop_codon:yes gene_type:complete
MILVCNGDSWTQGDNPAQDINWNAKKNLDWYSIPKNFGWEEGNIADRILYKFYDSNVWPKLLGKKFNFNTINAGRLGDDNFNISYRTVNILSKLLKEGKKDILVIIGWTSPIRLNSFTIDKNNKIENSQIRLATLSDQNLNNTILAESRSIFYYLNLQNFCESHNIRYVFFNAFDGIKSLNEYTMGKFINKEKWIEKDLSVGHFKELIEKHSDRYWTENNRYFRTMHPTDFSHKIWSDYLFSYITNNNLI